MTQLELVENRSINKKLSKAQFRLRAQEILGFLRSEYDPFKDDTPELQKRRKNRALSDPFLFFRTYLPHYFNCKFAPFHYELVSLLERRPSLGDSVVVKPVAVAAPREFAKSTITAFGYVLHQICFNLRKFVVLISDTQDLASDLTGYLYLEFCYNERLKHDFGKLVRDNWAVEDFTTLNDIRLLARGRGQRIRGLKHKQHRPDLVIMDDLENDSSARSPKRVQDLLRWISGTAYGAIDAHGNLFIIGTLLSKKSALATIIHSKEEPWCHWERRMYRALTDEGDSLWPAKHPLEVLEAQKEMMGTVAFNREKMNFPEDEEAYFTQEWFKYYLPEDLVDKELLTVAWFDPSLETGASADYKAIVSLGYDPREQIYYVLDAYIKRVSLEQIYQTAIKLHQIYGFQVFGVEDNLFQRLLLKEFERVALENSVTLPIKGITNYLSKESRIAGLSPLVERGRILFREKHSDQILLIEQLVYFPSTAFNDDGPDALQGAVQLVQKHLVKPADCQIVPGKANYYLPDNYREYASHGRRFYH